MTPTASLARAGMPLAVPAPRLMPLLIVVGTMTFNLVLCFVNTRVMGVSNIHVIGAEALFISLAFMVSYPSMRQIHLLLLAGVTMYTLSLACVSVAFGWDGSIDVKIVRDLAIPVAFFLLGITAGSARTADTVVRTCAAIVLVFALFEYASLDVFVSFFNVAKYYIARGTMEARDALQSADLFISGIRPAGADGGRNLLPFIGDHRASSVFLEPVSAGNFGIILVMWALIRSKFERTLYWGLLGIGLAVVVLADSRFGAYFCLLGVAMMVVPTRVATIGLAVLPAAALILLTVIPFMVTGSYDPQHRYIDNGFVGRLVLSGQILAEFDLLNWMGLAPSRHTTFDSGYAYIVDGIGVVGVAVAWFVMLTLRGNSRQFIEFRNLVAAYYGVILLVSNSPFTIKTAAPLWFMVGALAGERPAPRGRGPAIVVRPTADRPRAGGVRAAAGVGG